MLDVSGSIGTCNTNCPTNYTILPGAYQRDRGYCSFKCNYTSSNIASCPSLQVQINSPTVRFYDQFTCNAGYYLMNYECIANDTSDLNNERKFLFLKFSFNERRSLL